MEREYFKDRPESVQFNKNLYKGEIVFICLKKMQPYAKEISDLTMTKITANLTSQYQHPRGQKIKGEKIELDRYGNKIYIDEPEEVVGRCTYIVDDNCWSMDTNEGKKFLIYNNKKGKIDLLPYGLLKGYMKIFVTLKFGRLLLKMPFCRFTYFNDIDVATNFINGLVIKDIKYDNGKIIANFDNNSIYEDDFERYLDGKRVLDQDIYEYISIINNNKIGMCKLEIEEFSLEKLL